MFADGVFVTDGAGAYWTSPDGVEWTELAGADARPLAGFIDGHYLTLGWPASIGASDDLTRWQTVFDPGGSGLSDIAIGSPGA